MLGLFVVFGKHLLSASIEPLLDRSIKNTVDLGVPQTVFQHPVLDLVVVR